MYLVCTSVLNCAVLLYQLRPRENSSKTEVADVGSGKLVCDDCDNDSRVSFALVRLNLIVDIQRIFNMAPWFTVRSPHYGRF